MGGRTIRIIQLIWTLLIIIFVTYYLKNNLGDLKLYELEPNLSWFALAAMSELIRRLLGGIRWTLVSTSDREKLGRLEIFEHLHTFFISNLSTYIPGTVWYILSRLHLGQQKGHSVLKTSMSLVYETVLMVWSGAVVGSYLFVVVYDLSWVWTILLLFLLGGVSIMLIHPITVNGGLGLLLKILRRPEARIESTLGRGVVLLIVSLFVWGFGGSSLYFISRSLLPDLSGSFLPYVISLYGMGWVIGFLTPWAPAGLGIRDGIFVWGFTAYMASPFPVIVAILSRLISLIPDLFWAAVVSMLRIVFFKSLPGTETGN